MSPSHTNKLFKLVTPKMNPLKLLQRSSEGSTTYTWSENKMYMNKNRNTDMSINVNTSKEATALNA